MRILIVKLGAIGDIVHTLPSLAAIRSAAPGSHISWVVEARSAEMLRGNPMIDELIEIDTRSLKRRRNLGELVSALKEQAAAVRGRDYDIAIDFQGLMKSAAVAAVSGAEKRWGFSRHGLREPAARLLLTDSYRAPDNVHVIEKNLGLASAALGIPVPARLDFPVAVPDDDRVESDSLVRAIDGRFAILNPAGGWATKLWPAENYGLLADRLWEELGLVSLISVGPGEHALADRALAASRSGKARVVEPRLKVFYELARRADLYIGGDTGPTHIAIAAGTPIVGIFGPTEWWRNGSPVAGDICVERTDIDCRVNCHRRTCSRWICMDIDVEAVVKAAAERLAAASSGIPSAVRPV